MAIPNGGLINETNAQYYAGAQQFPVTSTAVGQTFTSTFDTNLVFGNSDPATNGYNLNNFKIYTSPDANVWTELTPSSPVASTTAAAAATEPIGAGTVLNPINLAVANTAILVGMTMTNTTGTVNYGVVASLTLGDLIVLTTPLTVSIPAADLGLIFKFISPWTEANNVVTVNSALPGTVTVPTYLKIQMNDDTLGDMHGSYEYTRLTDVIDNFLIAYVGTGKLIPSIKRTDVIFHAKRGLQEFSYDTLKSIRSSELTVPTSLSLTIPQDYVNYVSLDWVDNLGVLHPIYPTNNLNQSPYYTLAQDGTGNPIQDSNAVNTEVTSQIDATWDTTDPRYISGGFRNDFNNANILDRNVYNSALGQRYGLEPQTSQGNGWFKIDERKGTFSFTSNLSEKLILLQYISDGNAYDLDSRIPKLAEEALYAHIIYSILSTRVGIQEYIVRRFQKERSAKLRNAKIRLSNIKLDQIVQVMRGQSKWLKF
tara:strand:- start:1065 stop:2510 length:1446 start_codon:yes stop_codon:yes gene_type:complete